jgi:cellulose biosynthesis protein BcsQ
MNPLEIVHFIEELIRSEAKVIAFFAVGVLGTLVTTYSLRRWVFHTKDAEKELSKKETEIARKESDLLRQEAKIGGLERKLDAVHEQVESERGEREREKKASQERITALSASCEELTDGLVDQTAQAKIATAQLEQTGNDFDLYKRKVLTVVRSYKQQVASLSEQMRRVEQQEGRFWEAPVQTTIPPFRPADAMSAAIIAVTNLKGGVGKTSLTANIAATYWHMGKRVLVIDLDHQTSLTSLCLTIEQINDLRPGAGKFVNNLLRASANHATVAWDNLTRINDLGAFILAASKELADVEEHVKAKWLLNAAGFDSRYLLRAALHDPVIQDRFDVILLDCPPRPSTCLINALTCSDYVLIPAQLDRTSTETVPYLLDWLRKLREKKVCPDLSILGVVANRAFPRRKLISRERAVWSELADKCKQAWGEPVYHFDRFIPNSTLFAEAAATKTFAAHHPKLEPIFSALVAELQERKAHHESKRVAAVS